MSFRQRVRKSKDWNSSVPIHWMQTTPPVDAPRVTLPSIGSGLIGGSSYHWMLDVPDGMGYQFNPVYHEKYTATGNGNCTVRDNEGEVTAFFECSPPINRLDRARSIASSCMTPELLDDFRAKAEQSFISPLPDGPSIVNLVIELIDILTLDVARLRKAAAAWKDTVAKFFKRLREGLARGHGPASWWVAWRFAIRPTIKDVRGLIFSLQRAMKALEWLGRVNHRPVTRHFRTVLTDTFVGECSDENFEFLDFEGSWQDATLPPRPRPEMPPLTGPAIPGLLRLRIAESEVKLCATAVVRYDIEDTFLTWELPNIARVWRSMQWLYNPWAITWEATPFSWAIDWCLSERAKLERWKQFHETGDPFPLGKILSACWSAKIWLKMELVYIPDVGDEQVLATILYRTYSRELGLPDAGSSWLRSPISGYQLSIMTGVLDGRTRRR